MRGYYITFRSVTYAQRAEALLQRVGIGCTLQRTPRWMETQGCGYCIRLRSQNIHKAVDLLRTQQVPFRKLYLAKEDGTMEEVSL